MNGSVLTKDEIARLGREIYGRDIRREVEREHDGAYLVVDVTTGAYFLGQTDDEAFEEAEAKSPDGLFYLMRVGRRAAHRIGGSVEPD